MSANGDGKYKLKGRYGLYAAKNGTTNSDEALTVQYPLVRYFGTEVTRAGVLAAVGLTPPIGSLYFGFGTTGKLYVKIANAGVLADWEVVVVQAAD
jgi:hypothetical protein